MKTDAARSLVLAGTAAGLALLAAGPALACQGAGVILRIDGDPREVTLTRTENGKAGTLARPRVLEVVCTGDVLKTQNATKVQLSVDGVGKVAVMAIAPYTVPPRKGQASVAGNVYRTVSDKVAPDMKRLPWDVRLKGSANDFGFALPTLASGKQTLQAGRRDLLVRLVGGTGPYTVALTSEAGQAVASASSADGQALLRQAALTPGRYTLKATDGAGGAAEARLVVTAAGAPVDATLNDAPDPEVGVAVKALALAKTDPSVWAFEAEQMLSAAPANGLDRARVYSLLETYDTGE